MFCVCPASSRTLWLLRLSLLILGLAVALFMFRCVSLQAVFSKFEPEIPKPALGSQELKLLSEKHLRNFFTYNGIW